ncbi:hypothetical protein JKY79_01905 [Candidatus Babeliales bacterium]|nr:hypothetical protein [Candidatus Babeliales bacterium]
MIINCFFIWFSANYEVKFKEGDSPQKKALIDLQRKEIENHECVGAQKRVSNNKFYSCLIAMGLIIDCYVFASPPIQEEKNSINQDMQNNESINNLDKQGISRPAVKNNKQDKSSVTKQQKNRLTFTYLKHHLSEYRKSVSSSLKGHPILICCATPLLLLILNQL